MRKYTLEELLRTIRVSSSCFFVASLTLLGCVFYAVPRPSAWLDIELFIMIVMFALCYRFALKKIEPFIVQPRFITWIINGFLLSVLFILLIIAAYLLYAIGSWVGGFLTSSAVIIFLLLLILKRVSRQG